MYLTEEPTCSLVNIVGTWWAASMFVVRLPPLMWASPPARVWAPGPVSLVSSLVCTGWRERWWWVRAWCQDPPSASTRPAQLQTRGQSANYMTTQWGQWRGGQPLLDICADVCHHWKCVCCLIRMFGTCAPVSSCPDLIVCKNRSIARQSQLINY